MSELKQKKIQRDARIEQEAKAAAVLKLTNKNTKLLVVAISLVLFNMLI